VGNKRAGVFYEVLIRGFHDASGKDGTGWTSRGLHVPGLTTSSGWGSTASGCLPIYESPLRDGGLRHRRLPRILPEYGNIADFVELIEQAHKRGIRIIADLVMNHTSDAHPWFQAKPQRPPTAPFGDFYVLEWTTPDPVLGRPDHPSSTTRDPRTGRSTPVRGQYFWHRFFAHQAGPELREPQGPRDAMIEVLKFWLDLGIDGFRLDAVALTCTRREGTNCENLKETHGVPQARPPPRSTPPTRDRVLLAEANQWPADVVEYFGDEETGGNECHMGLPLPADAAHLHGRPTGTALTRSRRSWPQTPKIPAGCQWGIFLRNHDELTLEIGHRRRGRD